MIFPGQVERTARECHGSFLPTWSGDNLEDSMRAELSYEELEARQDAIEAANDYRIEQVITEAHDRVFGAGFRIDERDESRIINDGGDICVQVLVLVPVR